MFDEKHDKKIIKPYVNKGYYSELIENNKVYGINDVEPPYKLYEKYQSILAKFFAEKKEKVCELLFLKVFSKSFFDEIKKNPQKYAKWLFKNVGLRIELDVYKATIKVGCKGKQCPNPTGWVIAEVDMEP